MLPKFPKFKKLELSDRKDIEKITKQFPPYSDFNFISMWSWDTAGDMAVSELNKNLVIKFADYVTGKPFYSFLGTTQTTETARELILLSKAEGCGDMLKLIPESSLAKIDQAQIEVAEDRDHFDYIFSIEKLSAYIGSEYSKHRRLVKKFEKNNFEVVKLNLADYMNRSLLLGLVRTWVREGKKKTNTTDDGLGMEDFDHELTAFKKLMSATPELLEALVCSALFVDGILAGFIINEKISKDYCIAHFGKADVKHNGIYYFLMQQNAKNFLDVGVNYLNHEQDLGLPSLRYSKNFYRPVNFLKKYTLSLHH